MGEEKLEVVSHSLDEDGRIEQYVVKPPPAAQIGSNVVLEASEVTVVKAQKHKHPPKKINMSMEMSMKKRRAMGNM